MGLFHLLFKVSEMEVLLRSKSSTWENEQGSEGKGHPGTQTGLLWMISPATQAARNGDYRYYRSGCDQRPPLPPKRKVIRAMAPSAWGRGEQDGSSPTSLQL